MIDIVATLPGPLALGSDVHAPIRYVPGGSAANTAAWLAAAAGAAVALVGRVGDDAAGTQAHEELAQAGITDRLQIDWDRPTGTCIVLVSPGGERTMIPDPGANQALAAGDLDLADITAADHLHVSGYAILSGARAAALAAMAHARAVGATVSVDAASAAPLASFGADQFSALIGSELLLFANAAEARILSGASDAGEGARLLAGRFGQAVVKAGANGAYWSDGEGPAAYAAAVPLAQVIDTTGAGDAFAATFLAATRSGAGPNDALAGANEMAARACGIVGGRPPS